MSAAELRVLVVHCAEHGWLAAHDGTNPAEGYCPYGDHHVPSSWATFVPYVKGSTGVPDGDGCTGPSDAVQVVARATD